VPQGVSAHEARISDYVAATDRVEALKWDQGGGEATRVDFDFTGLTLVMPHLRWRSSGK
jgi:hypothetical protein